MAGLIRLTRMSPSSWFKIEYQNLIVHIDPGYGGLYKNQGIPTQELKDRADIVLVTHGHADHVRPEMLDLIAGHDTIVYAPEGAIDKALYPHHVVMQGQVITTHGIEIKVVPAYNTPTGHSTKKFHPEGYGVGYIISIDGRRIYHAGDTDDISEMSEASGVDVALLPIGGTYTLDLGEAIGVIKRIKPSLFIPMHERDVKLPEIVDALDRADVLCYTIVEVGASHIID
jgi:L-ascorbate metabolism protein UlaG (beta-lactamase superfamily)